MPVSARRCGRYFRDVFFPFLLLTPLVSSFLPLIHSFIHSFNHSFLLAFFPGTSAGAAPAATAAALRARRPCRPSPRRQRPACARAHTTTTHPRAPSMCATRGQLVGPCTPALGSCFALLCSFFFVFFLFFFFFFLLDSFQLHDSSRVDQLAGRLERTEKSTRTLLEQALQIQTDIDESFQVL